MSIAVRPTGARVRVTQSVANRGAAPSRRADPRLTTPRGTGTRAPVGRTAMLIYADGSALSRSLTGDAESASWLRWATEHADEIVTSPLALTEVRRVADPLGPVAREKARALARSVTVIRFSDQSLRSATVAASVLPPFAAIHLGIALTRVEIGAIATYDKLLAQVAALHQLAVVAPGRPSNWWL